MKQDLLVLGELKVLKVKRVKSGMMVVKERRAMKQLVQLVQKVKLALLDLLVLVQKVKKVILDLKV